MAEQEFVTRYVDLLIPADETPGALDLEVHLRIIAECPTNPGLCKLIKAGRRWFDREARRFAVKDFLGLLPRDQNRLIERSESSRAGTVEKRLFLQLRQMSFQYYYGDSRSWTQLSFQGPPQPLGHLDYRLPPGLDRP